MENFDIQIQHICNSEPETTYLSRLESERHVTMVTVCLSRLERDLISVDWNQRLPELTPVEGKQCFPQ